jgi:hypothetical protein
VGVLPVSYETTIASAKARAAEHEWKAHRQGCAACTAGARARKWDRLCALGTTLHHNHRAARIQLAENRRLDKAPVPGQEAML